MADGVKCQPDRLGSWRFWADGLTMVLRADMRLMALVARSTVARYSMARLIVGLVGTFLLGLGSPVARTGQRRVARGQRQCHLGISGRSAARSGAAARRATIARRAPRRCGAASTRAIRANRCGRRRSASCRPTPQPPADPSTPENRLATTDGNGRFEFENVRAGRYTLNAQKAGYVNLSFGQQRQNDASKPIDVLDGQTVEKIDFSLPRGGVFTGRILDEFGDPVADVQVGAMRSIYTGGARRLVACRTPRARQTTSANSGWPRCRPGDYYVSATFRNFNVNPQQETNDRDGYAPTYYPGTADLSAAQKLTIASGQTVSDITLALLPIRTARVSGIAVDSQGQPLRGMVIAFAAQRSATGRTARAGPVKYVPTARSPLRGLTPGDYTLQVQGQGGNGPDSGVRRRRCHGGRRRYQATCASSASSHRRSPGG